MREQAVYLAAAKPHSTCDRAATAFPGNL